MQQNQKWPLFVKGYSSRNLYYQMPMLQSSELSEIDPNVIHEVDEEDDCCENSNNGGTCKQFSTSLPVTESPDEGYVGENQENLDTWQKSTYQQNFLENKTLADILKTEDVVAL